MIRKISSNDINNLNKLASNFNIVLKKNNIDQGNFIGYFIDENLIGYMDYSVYYERAEINYIFVEKKYRNKLVASKLMEYFLKENNNLENVTLEVRENNNIAINFYKKYGFVECAKRKKYYGNEDAILMIRKEV